MDEALVDLVRLFAVFGGLVGAVLGLVGFLTRRSGSRLWHAGAAAFAVLLVGGGVVTARAGLPLSISAALLTPAVVVTVAQVLQLRAFGWLVTTLMGLAQRRWVPAGTLLAACPLAALLCISHLTPSSEDALPEMMGIDPERLIEVAEVQATTDAGLQVPLYALPDEDVERLRSITSDSYIIRERLARLIRTAEPDLSYNCHGWVFAAGRHWIKGRDVDPILTGNGYRKVAVPQAGDVVVYRSREGSTVLHTGLVRTVEPGLVLIESKWGALGRYVHRAADQCYGDNFAFYHTDRQGHALSGIDSTHPGSTFPATTRRLRRAG